MNWTGAVRAARAGTRHLNGRNSDSARTLPLSSSTTYASITFSLGVNLVAGMDTRQANPWAQGGGDPKKKHHCVGPFKNRGQRARSAAIFFPPPSLNDIFYVMLQCIQRMCSLSWMCSRVLGRASTPTAANHHDASAWSWSMP